MALSKNDKYIDLSSQICYHTAMTQYNITYFNNKVQQEIMGLPKTLAAKYAGLTKLMLEHGSNLGLPYTKSIKNG
jgi:hypothetical protein